MPWELAIRSRTNELLGSRDDVVQRMSKALPSIKWETEPPMPEEASRYSKRPWGTSPILWNRSTPFRRAACDDRALAANLEIDHEPEIGHSVYRCCRRHVCGCLRFCH